jgi:CRISPR/Cas system CSM-associated protein Csm3 (group 7 of RAMP superfamily)
MIKEKKYEIKLETEEPMRIGGKEDPRSNIDNPVAMVGNKVVVPGSTLKGALRSEVEKFLIEKYYNKQNSLWPANVSSLQPCIPSPQKNISNDEAGLITRHLYKSPGCQYPSENVSICPACYLLGAMGLTGFVRVPFLFADISPEELYSTRLDRAKGTVVTGTNRPIQLVPKGVEFKGTLTVLIKDDLLNWELGKQRVLIDKTKGDFWLSSSDWTQEKILKDLIEERLKNIKQIGGYRSKGFGKVKISLA